MSSDDHELMRRSLAGDESALEELVRRHQTPVVKVLSRLVGANGDLEDLAQDVFVRLLGVRRYQPRAAFSTWLYQIVLNTARDWARRQRLRRTDSLDGHALHGTEPGPDESAQANELRTQVSAALGSLPGELREALVLRHFGELTFAEVAAVLGLPASTVKSRVQTGLQRLRLELQGRGINEQELEP